MNPDQMQEDRGLIERAAKGDASAFREIVEDHQAMVYRTCFRMLGNEEDASDATQATFIVFHEKCRQLKSGTVLGGWLYRAAGLVSREFLRSAARRKSREEEASILNSETQRENKDIWNELAPELDGALTMLPAKYRDVVVLRYLEEKSTSETAGILGVSSSVVTTRLARGMEQLRIWFGRRGIATTTAVLSVVLVENASAASVPASLASSILATAGHGALAVPAKVSLMAKAALAKMGSLFWLAFEAFIFVLWIFCMAKWIAEGCPIPRWVHILAACLLATGTACVVAMAIDGMLTLELAASFILIPPAAAYVGWLWMFGPAFTKQ